MIRSDLTSSKYPNFKLIKYFLKYYILYYYYVLKDFINKLII